MITPVDATFRATPATKPVNPERAPLDRPSTSIGAFTDELVIFTMRPKPRPIIPSMVRFISSMGVSMLPSSALIHTTYRA